MKRIPIILFSISIFAVLTQSTMAQSFNEEKTAMLNFVRRMYNSSPFEGARKLEGVDGNYYVIAISTSIDSKLPIEKLSRLAENEAMEAAKNTFAEPCINFEMLTIVERANDKSTLIFLCEPLSVFISNKYKAQPFDGAKIVSTSNCSYFISVVTLSRSKFNNESIMDRVALIKAKQQANTLFNGSVISSDIMIYTDEKTEKASSAEIIREQSMGFVEGLEMLNKFTIADKVIYTFYNKLKKP